jgi:serine protease Do
MTIHLSKSKILAVGAVAFIAGIFFASSMNWTRILGAQGKVSGRSALVSNASLDDSQNAFVSVAERVTPAVVSVTAERAARPISQRRNSQLNQIPPEMRQFFQEPQDQGPQEAQGSGFIVSKDGYILTNNHVVDGADKVTIDLLDHRQFKAKVIGHDAQTDVAVLKIDATDLPTVVLGDDSKTRVGEWALAIGNPFGLDFTVTAGIISAKGRTNELSRLNTNQYRIQDFIQTDAAINPGNSGGPLMNIRGEVVGINTAIASETGSYTGYGFAIPITLAKTVMDDIIAHGRVRRAILGAQIDDVKPEDAAVAKLKESGGVLLKGFTEGSPAEKAGMEPGDIVVKIDGKPVDRVSALQRLIRSHQPGDVVDLEAVRFGEHKEFKVKLIEAPSDENVVASTGGAPKTAPVVPVTSSAKKLGVVVEALTPEIAKATGASTSLQGVAVRSVEHDGPAYGKIFPGDIITGITYPLPAIPVHNADDLQRALSKVKDGDYVQVSVDRVSDNEGHHTTIVLNLRVGS